MFIIKAAHSGKCLTAPETHAGANIVQWDCDNSLNQIWIRDKGVISGPFWKNRESGLYMDVVGYSVANGAEVIQWEKTGNLNQVIEIWYKNYS